MSKQQNKIERWLGQQDSYNGINPDIGCHNCIITSSCNSHTIIGEIKK